MRFLPKFLGGLALCLSQVSFAASLSGLYEVQLPLAEDSEQARAEAVQQSYANLIQRLTGDASKVAALALSGSPLELAETHAFNEEALRVTFDPIKVNSLLRNAGVALWSQERPQLLVWWEQDGLQGLQLLADGQARSSNLTNLAAERGLPVRFPLADLSEQVAGDQGLDDVQVRELIGRYATDLLLQVAVVPLTTGELRASWSLHGLGESQSGSLSAANTEALADELFVRLAKNLAGQYALVPGAGRELQVSIRQPDTDSFLAAERALKIFGARLSHLDGHEAVWTVTADPSQLRSQMTMQQFIEQDEEPASYRATQAGRSTDSESSQLVFERR